MWVPGHSPRFERQLGRTYTVIIKSVFTEVRAVQKGKSNEKTMSNICKYFIVNMIKLWNLSAPYFVSLQDAKPNMCLKIRNLSPRVRNVVHIWPQGFKFWLICFHPLTCFLFWKYHSHRILSSMLHSTQCSVLVCVERISVLKQMPSLIKIYWSWFLAAVYFSFWES